MVLGYVQRCLLRSTNTTLLHLCSPQEYQHYLSWQPVSSPITLTLEQLFKMKFKARLTLHQQVHPLAMVQSRLHHLVQSSSGPSHPRR
ncbi:hypothetical protein Pmani_015439 [Petrolisthes manimaculis]|uniref:Uncharacterized protein n=1 Tax=Petrolisthes manimaculis TaxID=1843537 RepID=A0AAE1PS82_9EUCA|nr:hypothetical protein Pmani_015439 [Petrolisthes manimaculis]